MRESSRSAAEEHRASADVPRSRSGRLSSYADLHRSHADSLRTIPGRLHRGAGRVESVAGSSRRGTGPEQHTYSSINQYILEVATMSDMRSVPSDTRDQALQIREAWHNISPSSSYADMALTEFEAAIAEADSAAQALARLEDQIVAAREAYHEKRRKMWDAVKRTRMAAKVKHGDDSREYERFGGTRLSEYKRRRTTAKPV